MHVPLWAWTVLIAVMVAMITIDLVAHRGDHVDSRRRAIVWTVIWIAAALVFNVWVALHFGLQAGEEFLAAYLMEKSLSVDNLFVFVVIFGALRIPAAEQRRVLTWGILGALITRGLFIAAGAALLQRWHAVIYVFGGLLIVTALRLLRPPSEKGEQKLLHWLERHLPWTSRLDGHHFTTIEAGRRVATPLLLALISIELTDIVFAIDSIPAAYAVTEEPFLVYSSNVFAVLGLRALYVVIAGAIGELRYLRFGLAAVLGLAGIKMLVSQYVRVPPLLAIGLIILCIGASVAASLLADRRDHAGKRPQEC